MKPNLKVADNTPLTPARQELGDAIGEVAAAQRTSDAANEAVELARGRLRTAEQAHSVAKGALDEALAPPRRPLSEKLAGVVGGSNSYFKIMREHADEPERKPVTIEDLKRMRQGVEATEDALVVARNLVERAEAQARPAASALNRAKDRRTRAIQEVVRPEVGRLMRDAQIVTEQLIAVRAALNFVANGPLTDSYSNDRRQASMFLTRFSFPSEQGLRTEDDLTKRDAAIARWQALAQRIETDASAELPTE